MCLWTIIHKEVEHLLTISGCAIAGKTISTFRYKPSFCVDHFNLTRLSAKTTQLCIDEGGPYQPYKVGKAPFYMMVNTFSHFQAKGSFTLYQITEFFQTALSSEFLVNFHSGKFIFAKPTLLYAAMVTIKLLSHSSKLEHPLVVK